MALSVFVARGHDGSHTIYHSGDPNLYGDYWTQNRIRKSNPGPWIRSYNEDDVPFRVVVAIVVATIPFPVHRVIKRWLDIIIDNPFTTVIGLDK